MKTFKVVLMKSYIVRIKAENKKKSKEYSELFTGDIKDTSLPEERKKFNFKIEDIDCKINESFDSQMVE